MRPERLKSLFHVLGEIAVPHRKAVFTDGRGRWPIERLFSQARRDVKSGSGSGSDKEALLAREYWWEVGPDDKVVVWRQVGHAAKPVFVEAGSYVTVAED